jgi:Holliday junction resolvasome RuvABC endonuclease subunit
MVARLLGLSGVEPGDATDALAVALCLAHRGALAEPASARRAVRRRIPG